MQIILRAAAPSSSFLLFRFSLSFQQATLVCLLFDDFRNRAKRFNFIFNHDLTWPQLWVTATRIRRLRTQELTILSGKLCAKPSKWRNHALLLVLGQLWICLLIPKPTSAYLSKAGSRFSRKHSCLKETQFVVKPGASNQTHGAIKTDWKTAKVFKPNRSYVIISNSDVSPLKHKQ